MAGWLCPGLVASKGMNGDPEVHVADTGPDRGPQGGSKAQSAIAHSEDQTCDLSPSLLTCSMSMVDSVSREPVAGCLTSKIARRISKVLQLKEMGQPRSRD